MENRELLTLDSDSDIEAAEAEATLTHLEAITEIQGNILKGLRESIPFNEHGYPEGFYNAETVINSIDPEKPSEEALEVLDYSEGYPSISKTGSPFWDRLQTEPPKFYKYFSQFLYLGISRNLKDLETTLAPDGAPSILLLRGLSNLYHWQQRAQFYDKFSNAVRDLSRIQLSRDIEDKHLQTANELFEKCQIWLQGKFEAKDGEAGLQERTVIDIFKMAISLQRISAGLPANGPKDHKDSGRVHDNSTSNTLIQNFIQNNGDGTTVVQLDKALQDPDTADLIQRLALKVAPKGDHRANVEVQVVSGEEDASTILETGGNI